ncbi:hypothetical protein [Priestia megaterium]|uniref:hypothetical protein n=1 Tax=Priestia megaterium TaxID=1404 RepID=UPI0034587B1E
MIAKEERIKFLEGHLKGLLHWQANNGSDDKLEQDIIEAVEEIDSLRSIDN